MKNKSTHHKNSNTFKFIPFSDRVSNIDVDVFHKVQHEYESQTEENESNFYQAIEKWNVLNLSEGYDSFRKEICPKKYITLPQVLLSKEHIIEVLIKHLKLQNSLCLQPLLEIVAALAKDLQKEFFDYYSHIIEVLIDLLNTKDTEVLEWTFTCLAYLFKFLWRSLLKNINNVFTSLLPLLSDKKPEYINNFAAESFAFVARKVRDRKAFLNLLLTAVKHNNDSIEGCGKLLFQVINGIDGQFHSCADTMLPFLLESLFEENYRQDVLFEILEVVLKNIVINIQPQKSDLLWTTFVKILDELLKKLIASQNDKLIRILNLILKLVGQSIEYKNGKILHTPSLIIHQIVKLLSEIQLPEETVLLIAQIGLLLLLSKFIKLSQEQASCLIRKILSLPHKSVVLYFVDNAKSYSSFEALILPKFLSYCASDQLEMEYFHVLTKIILTKVPLCSSGIALNDWKKYSIDLLENNLNITNTMLNYIKLENTDEILCSNFDNYFCSLICLPHLNIKNDQICIPLVEILNKNMMSLVQQCSIQLNGAVNKVLFLLNNTMECIVHLSSTEVMEENVDKILNCLLKYPQNIISLKTLSLCIAALKSRKHIITMETFLKINAKLEKNFSSPFHEIRRLTAFIYTIFEDLPEFELKYTTDPNIQEEDWKVFSICYNVESTEPHVHTYRNQLQNLEKLSIDMPQMLMCKQTDFKTIPLRFLCGSLYINFKLLWEPTIKILSTHARGLDINEFWNIFGEELKFVCENISNPKDVHLDLLDTECEFLRDLFQDHQNIQHKPDFVNYRLLLWKAMALFPEIAEAKTRDVSELVLNFVEMEYAKTSSDGGYLCSIKQNVLRDDENQESKKETDEEVNDQQTSSPNIKLGSKLTTKHLLLKLKVLAQVRSPLSMYREPELYKLYFDLLQYKDSEVQKAALDCIMTYKHKYLIPYRQNLYNLIDEKNFKNEITAFRIDTDSNVVLPEHRENFIPIVIQIVFSKMSVKTGLRTGGKSSSQMRRTLILRFLAGCQENEMLNFLQKAFRIFSPYLNGDPEVLVTMLSNHVDLEQFIPPKRLQSTINLLNVVLEQFGGLMGNDLLNYLIKIVLIIGCIIKGAFDQLQLVHGGYLTILKLVRTSCIRIVCRFFEHFERYPWSSKEINAIFKVFIWPYLNKLNTEGIHSPTTLLKLIIVWGSNPRYFPLLVKCEEYKPEQYILPHVMNLFINEKSHYTVITAIEEMLEKMLSLQPDDEDKELAITVDNVLPMENKTFNKTISKEKLNYGSSILITHVPIILIKIRRKLLSKAKNLNQRELFILSRISELVSDPDISDTILQLLLPLILKKCSTSSEEQIILRYLTTVSNLIDNVEKPQIHLKELSPLFAEIKFPSCRKRLCNIFEAVTKKASDTHLKSTFDLVKEMNAWDVKWLDQPDFERRHDAFKKILEITNDQINVHEGVLIIYNCYFSIRNEKDLSLRENATHSLKVFSPMLIKKYQNDHKQMDYILNDTLLSLIRKGMKSSKDDIRNEMISLLGHLSRECFDAHFILRDLYKYTNKDDIEVDFFENLTHLQIHRHARALLRFCQITKEEGITLNPRTLTQFVLPLASHYLCNEKYSNKNSVIDASIETVGVISRILPWHQYEGVLKYYLTKLRHKVDYQKQFVRLIVAILDAFHFDLSKGLSVNEKNPVNNPPASKQSDNKNTCFVPNEVKETNDEVDNTETLPLDEVLDSQNNDLYEDETEDGEGVVKNVSEKVTVLCKSTAARVINSIQVVLLPQLYSSLAEMTQNEGSHKLNRKKSNQEREEEELLRVPISLALVKLLQRLPVEILESNLPGIFMKICTFLKSQLESVRRVTRETLQKIMLTLGPKYLKLLLSEMKPLLNRGFQVHVLVFTTHGVLNCLKDMYQPKDVDVILLTVLNLCMADLFGVLSEEKEVVKIAVKVSEARSTKSYDTLQILAHYITESCLMDLILPIKQLLDSSHSFKTVTKVQDALKYIALGLVDNTFISTEALLKFAYGTSSKSIPQLMSPKKKVLTEKEREKLQREKEDCFIIPKIPGNRSEYRQQNVKTSEKANAHLLVEFGLRLCYTMLKREKLKDEEYRPYIDPFVSVFRKCLQSKHVKLSTLTLQCLSWIMKYELPSMKQNVKAIAKDLFNILHKYASAGLSKGDNFDLVMAAFKCVAVLVREVKYYTVDTHQLKILLLYAEQDMHDYNRQATAFNLLKAIISRKLVSPEMEDVMAKVAELSITSELNHVRTQYRIVFHQFLMEYPLGNTLEKHLGFYISQLNYEMQYGRESAIEMIQTLINTFPLNVLKNHSGTFLVTLSARLVNDEIPECRKMIANCLSSMLTILPKADRDSLYEIILVWLKDKNISHRRLAAQLCGIFVTVEKTSFETRLTSLIPLLMKQFGIDNTPGKFVKIRKENAEHSEEQERVRDHHLFQVLQLLLKLCAHCPLFLKQDVIDELATHIQTLLAYPHDWVRLAAAQFLGFVLSSINIDHLSDLISCRKSEIGYICADPVNMIKSLSLDLCDQLQPEVKSDLAEQVIKNLVFVARVLQKVPIKDDSENKINLLWLTKLMRKVVNKEVVENSSSVVLRTEILKWIAGVGTALDSDELLAILHHLLAPLVREMITTDEKNAPLRQLAKEVSNLLKKKVGLEKYTNTLSKLQQTLSIKRAERKRARTQLAVTDPEIYAKKKIKRHEKKKELRKRKIIERKGTKKNFKRRKVVDLEDNSEIM